MRFFSSVLVASALSLGVAPLPAQQGGPETKPSPARTSRAAAKKFQGKMQGAWKLTDMQLVAEDMSFFGEKTLEHVGYALVHGSYLSIEFHMRLVDKEAHDWGQSVVTGLHRFEVDRSGAMQTETVIATSTRRDGSPQFEQPGTTRRYDVTVEGETMTLTRDDGHRLRFERVMDDPDRFDIFGRRLPDDEPVPVEPEEVEEPERREGEVPPKKE